MAQVTFTSFSNVINGQLKGAEKQYHGINPFTEEKLWPVPVATEKDLDDAVKAASEAFTTWRYTTVEERRKRINDFSDALMAQKKEWAEIVLQETGQTAELADGEIDIACEYLTSLSKIDLPEYVTHEDDEVKVVTKYYPMGVVAAICPWNFPVFLAAGKIASALVTGNTLIIKPSPYTPYTSLKLAELAQNFFPPGVIQALGGDDNLGPWITKHPGISKISFTGSTATGKKIMAAAASTLKRVTLELGGNDACIVCPDVDINDIAPKIAEDAFSHAGQSCVACKRIYVHASIYDAFLKAFVAACKGFTPGEGFLSPVQNQMQYDKINSLFDDCKAQNLDFALGGAELKKEKTGYFIPAAIVSNPPESSRIVQEEPFGPILPIMKWETDEEVIAKANNTDQGLGASIWCQDAARAEKMADRIEAGSVWVNRGVVPMPTALFGGMKQSGLGGEWGPLGMLNYCDARTLHFAKSK